MAASLGANVLKICLCICLQSQCFSRRKWIVEDYDYSYFVQKFREEITGNMKNSSMNGLRLSFMTKTISAVMITYELVKIFIRLIFFKQVSSHP